MGKVLDAGANVTDTLPNSEEAIRRGEYAVIRSLIRVLEVFKNLIFILEFFFFVLTSC